MNIKKTFLPWNGQPVRVLRDVRTHLGRHLPVGLSDYLPKSITLFIDPEICAPAVSSFLRDMAAYLRDELQLRMLRRAGFVRMGLLSQRAIDRFLTERTHLQPWAIYYSKDGGLGSTSVGVAGKRGGGVVPCATMQNHGVAWQREPKGRLKIWLATARKPNSDWDWNSDIGHESAHAAFAHIPLFVQSIASGTDLGLASVGDAASLTPAHIARMIYFYSELAVVALRGEQRPTPTGLPVGEKAEMHALFRLSDELAPDIGFRQALAALSRVNGHLDVNEGSEIYEIASPVIKVLPVFSRGIGHGYPPDAFAIKRVKFSRPGV